MVSTARSHLPLDARLVKLGQMLVAPLQLGLLVQQILFIINLPHLLNLEVLEEPLVHLPLIFDLLLEALLLINLYLRVQLLALLLCELLLLPV